ncbi:MAG: hypothetical protein IT298_13760 [Chloroflexi bacterium]|jgi:hypothetical protein|nr:MAG: hypothetical protein UZ13_03571 [Chloroflexi bacterium OLB13]MBC6956598.1 hypothetical protein [Chloroflexota bacterium]MBV6436693.1 hypothetical protein [Anaerolineae bacterium]OQY85525.1 MAG: hypothetical protein B6D42_03280 [Anaerolineae bacterium UTCFX5]MCC6566819.1 hypothetical protein [Chloroflexota bacterium]
MMIDPLSNLSHIPGTAALSPDGCNVAFWAWGRGDHARIAAFSVYGVDRDVQQVAALAVPHGLTPFVRWIDHARFEYGCILPDGTPAVEIVELGGTPAPVSTPAFIRVRRTG